MYNSCKFKNPSLNYKHYNNEKSRGLAIFSFFATAQHTPILNQHHYKSEALAEKPWLFQWWACQLCIDLHRFWKYFLPTKTLWIMDVINIQWEVNSVLQKFFCWKNGTARGSVCCYCFPATSNFDFVWTKIEYEIYSSQPFIYHQFEMEHVPPNTEIYFLPLTSFFANINMISTRTTCWKGVEYRVIFTPWRQTSIFTMLAFTAISTTKKEHFYLQLYFVMNKWSFHGLQVLFQVNMVPGFMTIWLSLSASTARRATCGWYGPVMPLNYMLI